MFQRLRFALPILVAALVYPSAITLAQPAEREERIAASFVIALGRTPTAVELRQWATQASQPLSDLIARHRQHLQGDGNAARAVIERAGLDAFGPAPGQDQTGNQPGATYTELMQRHLRWLAERPAEYETVLRHAYRLTLRRDAYSIEIDYWKRQPSLSFALLAACIEDWARRNQPGLMATAGVAAASVNSAYLTTVRLSPALAAEARFVIGRVPTGSAALLAAAGRHVVAPGADHVASVGGIHFVAAGSARLTPPGTAD